jgi:hypothetical protein
MNEYQTLLIILLWALVAHVYNPSERRQRSGGSQFEGSRANSLRDPILKIPITKKGLVEWLKV